MIGPLTLGSLAGSCRTSRLQPRGGYVKVEGGRIWYRIVGSGASPPLVLVHGGPGFNSDYLDTLAALADERPVIFYDQLGGGKSDRPTQQSLWRVERFVDALTRSRCSARPSI